MNQPRRTPDFDMHAVMIQGDSVRMTWGIDERAQEPRKPVRRDPPPLPAALVPTDNVLSLRIAEELEYAQRMLDSMGDQLSADTAIVRRHGMALQSLDIVGQMLGHFAFVIRSSDPQAAVENIGMCDLKARLTRNRAL